MPKRARLLAELDHELGAHDALGETRVVLDVGRDRELAAGLEALEQDRLQVRARRVERRRVAGGTRADDRDLVDFRGCLVAPWWRPRRGGA